ncbi:MAG TPA: hypothetical protein VM823_07290, partial [Gaiellales bacterium]|nr:hypothetical protein [Gaiellales bacterium]
MHSVNLDEAEFYGRVSTPVGRPPCQPLECRKKAAYYQANRPRLLALCRREAKAGAYTNLRRLRRADREG